MKVVISYPPLQGPGSPMLTQNRQFQWYASPSYIYPVVPAMAATLLKNEGFDVIWNDCIAEKWTQDEFYKFIEDEKPDVIAFESKTPVIKQHWKIIEKLKERAASGARLITVLMGDHVTALPEESMTSCPVDFVVTGGDYDTLLLNIAKHFRDGIPLGKGIWHRGQNGHIENTGNFELKQDLNQLPFMDRKLTKAYLYGEKWKRRTPFFYTMAGRDCAWGKCTFCSWCTLYPKVRIRNPENLLDEIEILIKDHGAREIFDDMGTFPSGEWINKFCEGMIKRGINKKIFFSCNMRFGTLSNENIALMKKANFRKLKMGLESANQATLERVNKGVSISRIAEECSKLTKVGLNVHLTVMVGYPWETKADAIQTIKFADDLMRKGWVEMLQATMLVPYPGTPLYKEGIKQGWFRIGPHDYDKYDMREPVFNTPDVEPEELKELCRGLYKIFFSPAFMMRSLKRIRSFDDMGYVLRGAAAAVGHIMDFNKR